MITCDSHGYITTMFSYYNIFVFHLLIIYQCANKPAVCFPIGSPRGKRRKGTNWKAWRKGTCSVINKDYVHAHIYTHLANSWINALTKCKLVVALQFLMAGHLEHYCLEGDTSIHTLTLKEQFGKAKHLLAVRKLKMFECLISSYTFICLLPF